VLQVGCLSLVHQGLELLLLLLLLHLLHLLLLKELLLLLVLELVLGCTVSHASGAGHRVAVALIIALVGRWLGWRWFGHATLGCRRPQLCDSVEIDGLLLNRDPCTMQMQGNTKEIQGKNVSIQKVATLQPPDLSTA